MAPSGSMLLMFASILALGYAMPGGFKSLDVDDEKVLSVANKAITELSAKSNSMFAQKLIKVTDARQQVVAGINYRIKFDLGTTGCLKADTTKNLEACAVNENEQVQECEVTYFEQSWTNTEKLTDFSCKAKKDNEQEKHEEETNEIYQKAAASFFQQARGNIDAVMNQLPGLPPMAEQHLQEEPAPPQKVELNIGGDDHDIGNYGAFENFRTQFNKEYKDSQELKRRFLIFRGNMKKVVQLQKKEQGSAKYGATEFADMTEEEFRKTHLTPRWDTNYNEFLTPAAIPTVKDAPDAWDWRAKGAVTPVKNQGQCGSCWAFSTTGNIEGQWAIKSGSLTSLSEQELVDCDKLDEGCNGGLPSLAYQEIIRLGGLETEADYPYEAEGEKCAFVKSKAKVDITGAVNISSNEDDMKQWLYKNGPISIGINAMAMQFYMGGVSHPWSIFCDPESLDHGVLIVGYGVQSSWLHGDQPYWIVKNSWGPTWGEKGYYLVYRGDGTCGLNRMATSAVIN